MSLHSKPAFNTPDIITALKAHGLEPYKPSQLSDGFRLGWIASELNDTNPFCSDCLQRIGRDRCGCPDGI